MGYRANKNALYSPPWRRTRSGYMLNISGSRGTTFIRCSLAIATSLGTCDLRVAVPRIRLRGLPARSTFKGCRFTSQRFLLAASGVFFTGRMLWAFHQWPTLWMQRNLLLVPSTLYVIWLFLCVVLKIPSNQGCVNGVFSQGMCVWM